MLKHLYVRNLAVVEEAEVEFDRGLTVVTGETGAGKSLLVDALLLLSGQRADSTLVRAGEDRAELSAEFDLAGHPAARAWLVEQALDDGGNCQLRRVLRTAGSSRAWINGRPVTLTQLADLAALLIEIHGQHEHQALLSRAHQLALLDACADAAELRAEVGEAASAWQRVQERIQRIGEAADRSERIALRRHELAQLQQWLLPAEALEALEAEQRRLANADRLLAGAGAIVERLDGDDELAVNRAIARTEAELQQLAELDPALAEPLALAANAGIQIGELVTTLNHYADALESDPERLDEIDTHLAALQALSRRHRVPVAELAERQQALAAELEELEDAGASLEALTSEREVCLQRYRAKAAALAKRRAQQAAETGKQVSALMAELGMAGGCFEVALEPQASEIPDPLGSERCEFMVSANAGQPPRPLRKVASGGELSRISLALRVAAIDEATQASMVFDEVDSGIGGAVAEVVGRKLRRLGEGAQVLCVTHLPQVAAQAHAHLKVSKATRRGHTHTRVERLQAAARRDEVARMLGGIDITPETEAHAEQMIGRAQAR